MSYELNRREFLKVLAGSGLAFSMLGGLGSVSGCSQEPHMQEFPRKVLMLAFDGVEPSLFERWLKAGELPNLARLASNGSYTHIATTNPPETPVAFASFSTGCNPGKHGVFDFLKRDLKTYYPDFATVSKESGKLLWNLIPVKKPRAVCNRGGVSFWKIAADAGVRSTVLQVPVTFPPEEFAGGYLFSGLGVPDIMGTFGTFYYFATDLRAEEVGNTELGGKIIKIDLKENVAHAEIEGPQDPTKTGFCRVKVPVEFIVHPEDGTVTITLQGKKQRLSRRRWSEWFEISYPITPLVSVKGIGRFYCNSVIPELQIYLCPVNFNPKDPPFAFTYPQSLSKELFRKVGMYKCLGWPIDTWAIDEERIDEQTFMEDVFSTEEKRDEMTLYMLKEHPWNLFISVYTGTDQAQHVLYRLLDPKHPRFDERLLRGFGDAVLKVYKKMDDTVAKVQKFVDKDTFFFVFSDHGFHSFRRQVNLNTWLVRNGFMTLERKGKEGYYTLEELFGKGEFFPNVKWEKTKAYSLGLGQIFINLQGRESRGMVKPGEEYNSVKEEIARGLLNLRDPVTGERVILGVYKREDIYRGPYVHNAPDLMVGCNDGYRVSWQCTMGGVPPKIVEDNLKKWSGDHCAFDFAITPGILVANRKIHTPRPSILDLAPTALEILGLGIPPDMDGRPLGIS